MAAIVERLDRLERENAALRDEVGALRRAPPVAVAPRTAPAPAAARPRTRTRLSLRSTGA